MNIELNNKFKEQLPALSKVCGVGTPDDALTDWDKVQILKHCIDKQRVVEAILKHTMKNDYQLPISINGHFHVRREDLLKELGLEK